MFGLTLASEMEFPELFPSTDTPAVTVRSGIVPASIQEPLAKGVMFEANAHQYLLRVPSVASYFVSDGRDVVVQAEPGMAPATVRAFFLGSVLTALLQQRGTLVLHAAGVVGRRGVVLLAGHSGLGKSTLLTALTGRGYQIIADDAAALTVDDRGGINVLPGVPQTRLWKDAIERLGLSFDGVTRARNGIDKFILPLRSNFADGIQPLSAVFVLGMDNTREVKAEPISAERRFHMLRAQTRNYRGLVGARQLEAHFRTASAVAARVPFVHLTRPRERYSLDELIGHIEPALV